MQLKRIALALGLTDTQPAKTSMRKIANSPDDALREAVAGGLPVMQGRPDDPMLDLVGW